VEWTTLEYQLIDGVATVTLNRPHKMNAVNATMMTEFRELWPLLKDDDDVRVVVLRARGDRAFSTGLDRVEGFQYSDNVWNKSSPAQSLSPKHHLVWKPLVCAVNGICGGGAYYWLNDADIVIAAEDAAFFDPHVDFGLTAGSEPIGLARRIPIGEVMRIFLVGLEERMSAQRAREIGLVSEVVPADQLWARAVEIAAKIARKPPAAVQGTVRAVWESFDLGRTAALERALMYTMVGNPIGESQAENYMATGRRLPYEIR
jgi:enoyl-CoA hydratase/carnithine racemase